MLYMREIGNSITFNLMVLAFKQTHLIFQNEKYVKLAISRTDSVQCLFLTFGAKLIISLILVQSFTRTKSVKKYNALVSSIFI